MSEYELKSNAHKRKSLVTCLLNSVLVIAVCAITLIVVPLVAQVVRVQGDSMAPSLRGGQLLFVNRLAYRFSAMRPGDIIVFTSPGRPETVLVKRVIALPGDRVSIRQGVVSINNSRLEEPYVVDFGAGKYGPVTVGQGTVFVLGDHRSVSNDSLQWGMLPLENIIGRAEFSVWPPEAVS